MEKRELKTGDIFMCVNIPKKSKVKYETGKYYPIEVAETEGARNFKYIAIKDENGNKDIFEEGSYFHTEYFHLCKKEQPEVKADEPTQFNFTDMVCIDTLAKKIQEQKNELEILHAEYNYIFEQNKALESEKEDLALKFTLLENKRGAFEDSYKAIVKELTEENEKLKAAIVNHFTKTHIPC